MRVNLFGCSGPSTFEFVQKLAPGHNTFQDNFEDMRTPKIQCNKFLAGWVFVFRRTGPPDDCRN